MSKSRNRPSHTQAPTINKESALSDEQQTNILPQDDQDAGVQSDAVVLTTGDDTGAQAPAATPEPTPEATPEPTAAPEPERTLVASVSISNQDERPADTGTAPADPSLFEQHIERLRESGAPIEKHIIAELEAYRAVMGPGKSPTVEAGEAAQIQLWRLLRDTLRNEKDDYRKGLALLVAYFREFKRDFLGAAIVYSYFDSIPLNADQTTSFNNLLTLFVQTAQVNSLKAATKQVDIARVMPSAIFKTDHQQRLAQFFNA